MPVRRAPRSGYAGARAAAICWMTLGYWPTAGTTSTSTLSNPRQRRCHRSDRGVTHRERDTSDLLLPAPGVAEPQARYGGGGNPGAAGRRGERDFAARRCPPPLPVYPQAPGHRVVLAVERYGMALPWVPGLRRVTCVLLLPPTVMSRGWSLG
jgi:hypothetical protein